MIAKTLEQRQFGEISVIEERDEPDNSQQQKGESS